MGIFGLKQYRSTTFCVFGFLMCLVVSSSAQTDLKLKLDTSATQIGYPVDVRLILTSSAESPSGHVVFPQLTVDDTLTGGIEIWEVDTLTSKIEDNISGNFVKTIEQRFVVAAFDTGYIPVEPLTAIVDSDTITSNAELLYVKGIQVDTSAAIRDLKQLVTDEISTGELLAYLGKKYGLWTGLSLIIVALAIYLWIVFKRRRNVAPIQVKIEVPPYEWAIDRLKHIESRALWQNNKVKEYHTEITMVIRGYIEKRYAIQALEKTTDEIVSSMRMEAFSAELKDKLRQLLLLADLVKFAKENPLTEENQRIMLIAREFINETKVSPIANTESPGANTRQIEEPQNRTSQ